MKRAQAAMEFLLNYGWAILVVIVAVAAMAYFGIDYLRVSGENCLGEAGLACIEYPDAGNLMLNGEEVGSYITFAARNSLGKSITLKSIQLSENSRHACGSIRSSYIQKKNGEKQPFFNEPQIEDGELFTVVLTCSNKISAKATEDFRLNYQTARADIPLKSNYHVVVSNSGTLEDEEMPDGCVPDGEVSCGSVTAKSVPGSHSAFVIQMKNTHDQYITPYDLYWGSGPAGYTVGLEINGVYFWNAPDIQPGEEFLLYINTSNSSINDRITQDWTFAYNISGNPTINFDNISVVVDVY